MEPEDEVREHERRGFALFAQGRFDAAAAELDTVARMQPNSASAHSNLAAALAHAGHTDAAIASLRRALGIDATLRAAHVNVAHLLAKVGRQREAVQHFMAAQRECEDDPLLHFAAGQLYFAQGLREQAIAAFDRALDLHPGFARARWMRAIAVLPHVYGEGEDPAVFRLEFEAEMRALAVWFEQPRLGAEEAVGERHPFYLAYMEESNLDLLSSYGDLCSRLMRSTTPAVPGAASPAARRRVRLAVVSGHFHDQSVWTALLRGWLAHLDRSLVELHLFYTGSVRDAETALAEEYADHFSMGLGSTAAFRDAILASAPEVILYPEIGMDPIAARLGAIRLAPVQAVSWGHPETSGYPTIDYYLSAEAFEPEGAQAHYRERLRALPGIGCYYDDLVPEFAGVDWTALGIDPYAPRLLCAGTPYKYMPQHDDVLVEVVRRVPDAQLLFFVDPAPLLSERLERRLSSVFGRAGLDPGRHVRFLPRLPRSAFFAMLRDCDALLDTVGFSGFNTAMQALECDLPVVAFEGRFMRGRLASGALRLIGMDEIVARTKQEYADLAARLCVDGTFRLKTSALIAKRKGPLFRDEAPVRALERFLCEVTGWDKGVR